MCHMRGMVFEMPMHHGMPQRDFCCCAGFGRISGREEMVERLKEYREELKSELERVEARLRALQSDVQE
ncbi:MAG: hypothetical protein QHG98_05355 [Methanothrix sp.]|uniref:hypothetical protein n=1 Tax=Methanothrix sp. TaxID=90426 RepID=UPI00247E3F33|nr:hypothetical protein [Methanothrix sp.]